MTQVVDLEVLEMRCPTDVSGLERLLSERVNVEDVVAVVGKTEGTGLGKDNGREAADHAIKSVIARRLGVTPAEVSNRVTFILSGGCPGVITPHIALITRRRGSEHIGTEKRLVVGLAHSEPIDPHEIGRTGQITKVAQAVRAARADAGHPDQADIHAVLVKGPALTESSIAEAAAHGLDTVTRDLGIGPEGAICYSNDSSALGVAVGVGELSPDRVRDSDVRSDYSLYSDVAFTSSGGEKSRAEVLLLANSTTGQGNLRVGHSSMTSILDLDAAHRAMAAAAGDSGRPAQVVYPLAKMIIPGSAVLNGRRTTLHDDPHGYHVAKGIGGYLVAVAMGTTAAFVSGGEHNSHQGPPDGNPLAVIMRIEGNAP